MSVISTLSVHPACISHSFLKNENDINISLKSEVRSKEKLAPQTSHLRSKIFIKMQDLLATQRAHDLTEKAIHHIIDEAQKKLKYSRVVRNILLYISDTFNNDLIKSVIDIRSHPEKNNPESHEKLYDKFRDNIQNYINSCDNEFSHLIETIKKIGAKKLENLGLNSTQLEIIIKQLAVVLEDDADSLYRAIYKDREKFITSLDKYQPVRPYFDYLHYSLLDDLDDEEMGG